MHYETVKCSNCGKEFVRRSNASLCRDCRPKTNQKVSLVCGHCGVEFLGLPDTLYCRKCRNKWVSAKAPIIACDVCGADLKSLYGETTCEKCRHNARIAGQLMRTCQSCGKKFTAETYNELLCPECKLTSNSVECTCIVCGKKFIPKRKEECKTCSRVCQGLYIQAAGYGMKYDTDDLYARVISHIQNTGVPISIEALGRELGGITHKVFTARGWTMQKLLDDAGVDTTWFPANMSTFEHAVYDMLRANIAPSVDIELQKTFSDCVGLGGRCLKFDFYIRSMNLIVEADGAQHYSEDPIYHDRWDAATLQAHDAIKNRYCSSNGIALLRIRYERYITNREGIIEMLKTLLPPYGEIRKVNCFNCWNGSELVPILISNQASDSEEGSQTIP